MLETKLYVPSPYQTNYIGGNFNTKVLVPSRNISYFQGRCIEKDNEKIIFEILQEGFPISKIQYEFHFGSESDRLLYQEIEPRDFVVFQEYYFQNSVTHKRKKGFIKDPVLMLFWVNIYTDPRVLRGHGWLPDY
ncbi:MAG: hypothetical protein OEX08_00800 [Candidatus Nomurabacteria bacterium]|nr:hypothetical protein [Candidatus Nomurabacteria bacterium]